MFVHLSIYIEGWQLLTWLKSLQLECMVLEKNLNNEKDESAWMIEFWVDIPNIVLYFILLSLATYKATKKQVQNVLANFVKWSRQLSLQFPAPPIARVRGVTKKSVKLVWKRRTYLPEKPVLELGWKIFKIVPWEGGVKEVLGSEK